MADDYQEKGYPRGYDVDEHLLEVTGPKILVDSEGEEERWVESEGEDGLFVFFVLFFFFFFSFFFLFFLFCVHM